MTTQNPALPRRNYLVVGTDTEVGKTVATAVVALYFQSCGHDVGVMKPFASGCGRVDGELQSEDARWLKEITGVADTLQEINPARWQEPLAPLVAARRAGDSRDGWSECEAAYRVLEARHEVVIVEGVGGLLAPIADRHGKIMTNADWANALKIPVLLVARRTLGTINHTLMTVEVLRARQIEIAGFIFCDAQPVEDSDVAAQTSPAVIAAETGLPILGIVPHLQRLSRDSLVALASDCIG